MLKNIEKYRKIYVVCPASSRTGGLELLHQLTFVLNLYKANAIIAYTNIGNGNPTNPAYKKYVSNYVSFDEIEDEDDILVIISEHQVELMDKLKKAEVAIWWLSVDNYQKVYNPIVAYKLLGIKGVAWYIKHGRWKYNISCIRNKVKFNFAQSYYAVDFLKQNGFSNIEYLSDYINSDYLNVKIDRATPRKDVVLYNPKKGAKFSKYLISLNPTIKWVPLVNLTNAQVKDLLLSSKVYVDFGNHPGKDRFPREAAMCGCCVITDKRGSAAFYKDVPIDARYKFDDEKELGKDIIKCIQYCFDNYETCVNDFDDYRQKILREEEQFHSDVKSIFFRGDNS